MENQWADAKNVSVKLKSIHSDKSNQHLPLAASLVSLKADVQKTC